MLWFVGQPRPVEVTLRAMLIYFVRFVAVFLLRFACNSLIFIISKFLAVIFYLYAVIWCLCKLYVCAYACVCI
jgi:hypothetical protein